MNNKYHVSNQRMYSTTILHRTVTVDGLSIFYREAGGQSNPKLVLLHGFPSSSHQYRITLMKGIEASDVDRTGTFTRRNMDKLEGHDDYRIDGCLRVIKSLNDEINTVSKRILLLAKEYEIAKLLMTIPGIGYYYSALLIISEIGEINRFPNSYHLCSYAGLVPSTYSSGGVTHYGSSITKTGSKYLRKQHNKDR